MPAITNETCHPFDTAALLREAHTASGARHLFGRSLADQPVGDQKAREQAGLGVAEDRIVAVNEAEQRVLLLGGE